VYQQQQQQQEQQEEQDAENPFLDPPFSRIKIETSQAHKIGVCICCARGQEVKSRHKLSCRLMDNSIVHMERFLGPHCLEIYPTYKNVHIVI
jgi:hypothetical protein